MTAEKHSRLGEEAAEALRQDGEPTPSDDTTRRRPRKPAGDSLFRMPVKVRDGVLQELRGAPLSVWVALLSRANKQRLAWPSLETLCDDTGYRKSAVYSALVRLLDLRLIEPTMRLTTLGPIRAWRVPKRADILTVEDRQDSDPVESHSAPPENLSAPAESLKKTTKKTASNLQDNHFGEDDASAQEKAPDAHLPLSDLSVFPEQKGEPVEVALEILEAWIGWRSQPPSGGASRALATFAERMPASLIVAEIEELASKSEQESLLLWLALGRFEREAREAG